MTVSTDYQTTADDYEVFKKEFVRWQGRFGLVGWETFFEHDNVEDYRAEIAYNCIGRSVTVTLSKTWKNFTVAPTEVDIRKVAFHEACELLLGRIKVLARERFLQPSEIDEEIHAIIRTLENAVFWHRENL